MENSLKTEFLSQDRLFSSAACSSVVWLEGKFETWGLWTPSSFLDSIQGVFELKWEKDYTLTFTNI